MKALSLLPFALLASLPLASPAFADGILPGEPLTGAPELFSMRLAGGVVGLDVRYTLYADRTFAVEDGGNLVLVAVVERDVFADFGFALRTSGFLGLDARRLRTAKGKPDALVVSLSAYAGAVSYTYAAVAGFEPPVQVDSAESAFEHLVAHVLVTSGFLGAGGGEQ